MDGSQQLLAGTAVWARLSGLFRSKIASGDWPVGFQIPTIDQMSRDYGVARVTIRQALSSLIAEGLLSSQRGRGTFVTAQAAEPRPAFELVDVSDATLEFSLAGRIEIMSHESVSEVPSGWRQGRKSVGQYILVRKRHLKGRVPLFSMEAYVSSDPYFRFVSGRESKEPIQGLLRNHLIRADARVDTVVRSASADHVAVQCLGVPFASPLMDVSRVFVDGHGAILLATRTLYKADTFRFKISQTVREYLKAKLPSNASARA